MRGFTFIELVVTVTLILVMSSLVIAGYNGFNSAQSVVQGAQTLKTNLVRIRTMATSGNKPQDCDELVGYKVEFFKVPDELGQLVYKKYTGVALCNVDGDQSEVGVETVYMLPKNVQFVFETDPPDPIIFYVLDRGTSGEYILSLSGKGTGKSVNVWVSGAGVVSDYIAPTATPTP